MSELASSSTGTTAKRMRPTEGAAREQTPLSAEASGARLPKEGA